MKRISMLALLTAAVLATAACQARKEYPEPNEGYHNVNYSVLFGRLDKVAAADPEAPPVWVVRFGGPSDGYQGQMALTDLKNPAEFTRGYAGGEPVEIHGHLYPQPTTDAFNGRWYVVDSIKLWSGYRQ